MNGFCVIKMERFSSDFFRNEESPLLATREDEEGEEEEVEGKEKLLKS